MLNKLGEMLIFLVSKEIPSMFPTLQSGRANEMWAEICWSHHIQLSPAFTPQEVERAAAASQWLWGKGPENCIKVASGFWKMAAATCLWASYNVIQIPNLCKLHLGKYCYFVQKVLLSACHIPGTILGSRNPEGANQKKPALVTSYTTKGSRTGNTKYLFISNSNDKGSL